MPGGRSPGRSHRKIQFQERERVGSQRNGRKGKWVEKVAVVKKRRREGKGIGRKQWRGGVGKRGKTKESKGEV